VLDKESEFVVLYAEDDDDQILLIQEAFKKSQSDIQIRQVRDGEELMDYLLHRGAFTNPASAPRPDVVLLDLNMPKKDGREALNEIKGHALLRHIPVVVLTTSRAEDDIIRCYELGANSYIRKPLNFIKLIEILKAFSEYWFRVVALPFRGSTNQERNPLN